MLTRDQERTVSESPSGSKRREGQPILRGKGLTKFFGGLAALSKVDFELYENEVLGLIGPNGAGKTTLFHIIAGMYKPDQGLIHFRGENITGLRPDQICRKGIARTFQIPRPFLQMTVLENVMAACYFGRSAKSSFGECQGRAEEILSLVGLADKCHAMGGELTLVERKRLELARALGTEPCVLLLDEVIAGLNPTETQEMINLLARIRDRGMSLLMIEHVMRAVMGISDRVIVLHHGQKISEGSPQEVVRDPGVVEAYLGGMANARLAGR
jgi:branched-chain amino acid transport system ATP-binding protein